MPEKDFWRTMNPARLHMLFDAWFGRQVAPDTEEQKEQKRSLSAYIQGGG